MVELVSLDKSHCSDIIELLSIYDLPIQDINPEYQKFFGIYDRTKLVACGGLEISDVYGLLRSLAVDKSHQNQGLGKLIFDRLIYVSNEQNLKALYLLTLTASDYFRKKGFEIIDRKSVPEIVTQTKEFKSLCPDSAICMQLKL